MKAAVIIALALLLAACGGGEECRPDFMGPPAPGFKDLPLCGGVATINPVDPQARPETVR